MARRGDFDVRASLVTALAANAVHLPKCRRRLAAKEELITMT